MMFQDARLLPGTASCPMSGSRVTAIGDTMLYWRWGK